MSSGIVLVEDNLDDVALMTRMLGRFRLQNEITVLKDGQAAVEYFFGKDGQPSENSPMLVLLDLGLPGVPGFRVLERLRQNPRTQGIPVIVFTSSTDEEDRIRSLKLGAIAFHGKPVHFADFALTVQRLGLVWTSPAYF